MRSVFSALLPEEHASQAGGGWQTARREADYGLALYVMLSRATKLSDLTIAALPDRQYFEGFLHQRNGMLVERMKKLEEMSARSTNSEDPTS